MFSPLEAIDEEIQNTADMQEQLKECIVDGGLPPSYFKHPVKVDAPEGMPVYPGFLYIDGGNFQLTDSCIHPIAQLGLRSHRSIWPWRMLGDHRRAFGARAPKATIGKRRKTGL